MMKEKTYTLVPTEKLDAYQSLYLREQKLFNRYSEAKTTIIERIGELDYIRRHVSSEVAICIINEEISFLKKLLNR